MMKNFFLMLCLGGPIFCSTNIWACAVCFGAQDSPMTSGLNVGILTMLGVVGGVLFGIAAFIVNMIRRSKGIREFEGGAC